MENTTTPSFEITAQLDGIPTRLTVNIKETTDGISYYCCLLNENELTEVREFDGKWEQLWGDLDEINIQHIGNEIEKHLE